MLKYFIRYSKVIYICTWLKEIHCCTDEQCGFLVSCLADKSQLIEKICVDE